jgi:peptide methionine sulfoxide reductase msrA/msrB
MKRNRLTPEEVKVIRFKGTEPPFSGKYDKHFENGIYTCKQCNAELFHSSSKYSAHCGWPSFDDQVREAVKCQPDADGRRIEVVCARCKGHLGHVFTGENHTEKNTRYCVNSLSLNFSPAQDKRTEKAVFAGGCFWGVEYLLKKIPGVISTSVGYTGGTLAKPSYQQVCTDRTGHAEALEILFDPNEASYETLARRFFEIHDFTQFNRQGPDVGSQYRSAVFYTTNEQKKVVEGLIEQLTKKGHKVKTQVIKAGKFWPAEIYHQDYYQKTGGRPYCHRPRKVFD